MNVFWQCFDYTNMIFTNSGFRIENTARKQCWVRLCYWQKNGGKKVLGSKMAKNHLKKVLKSRHNLSRTSCVWFGAIMSEKAKLASSGNDIKLWEVPGFTMTNSISAHSQPVTSLCWGNNNILLWPYFPIFSLNIRFLSLSL